MDLEKIVGKSAWKRNSREPFRYFCPHCKEERKVPLPPEPQARHYFQVFVGAAFFTAIFWPIFDFKGLVSFIPFWAGFEAVYRIKSRTTMTCDNCGFDPALYMVDAKQAREQVDAHFKKKFAELGISYPDPNVPFKPPGVEVGQILNTEGEKSGGRRAAQEKVTEN